MNHLAHFHLSGDDENLILGNFIADFVNKKQADTLPLAFQNGILLHRAIDMFTDSHAVVRKSTQRLHASQHKYAPVVVDILYDYFLSKHWNLFEPLTNRKNFIEHIYKTVKENIQNFPEPLKTYAPRMIGDDWLNRYSHFEGLEGAFERMARRLKFENRLPFAVEDLQLNYEGLEADFLAFYPQLLDFCIKKGQDFKKKPTRKNFIYEIF